MGISWCNGYLMIWHCPCPRWHAPLFNATVRSALRKHRMGPRRESVWLWVYVLKYLFIILWQALRFIWLMHAARAYYSRLHNACVCVCVWVYPGESICVLCKAAFCSGWLFVYLYETRHSIMPSHMPLLSKYDACIQEICALSLLPQSFIRCCRIVRRCNRLSLKLSSISIACSQGENCINLTDYQGVAY